MSTDFERICDEYENEFLSGDQPKPSDLAIMRELDFMFPGRRHIVGFARHDEIGFAVSLEEFNDKATDEQARELHRMGMLYLSDSGCLGMFV